MCLPRVDPHVASPRTDRPSDRPAPAGERRSRRSELDRQLLGEPRWGRRSYRVGAPVLLGCSPWVTDDEFLATIERLPGACIVLTKAPGRHSDSRGRARLREVNERTSGIELRALAGLRDKAPKVNGKPRVLGPYDEVDPDLCLPTFRSVGYRKVGKDMPPIAHAKLALLGHICWSDEHPTGHVDDFIWFAAKRLWVSSANFTYHSRRSLEFGYWTEHPELMRGVERFIAALIGVSEDLDAAADEPDPDLANLEFDDQAMAEAAAASYMAYLEEAEMLEEEAEEAALDEDDS